MTSYTKVVNHGYWSLLLCLGHWKLISKPYYYILYLWSNKYKTQNTSKTTAHKIKLRTPWLPSSETNKFGCGLSHSDVHPRCDVCATDIRLPSVGAFLWPEWNNRGTSNPVRYGPYGAIQSSSSAKHGTPA